MTLYSATTESDTSGGGKLLPAERKGGSKGKRKEKRKEKRKGGVREEWEKRGREKGKGKSPVVHLEIKAREEKSPSLLLDEAHNSSLQSNWPKLAVPPLQPETKFAKFV
ncbi:hypothetical protein DUI87_04710 [Hirundo rustica rustica]|uniref:Uncharacterized protein n=1 Tax=Hirundo rustica rustica TaxID=333673 RepID=A0A3M0L4K1_HIRRU|nr:hypothetical protein DUI87_04710 [Hirundo rustica rustica]